MRHHEEQLPDVAQGVQSLSCKCHDNDERDKGQVLARLLRGPLLKQFGPFGEIGASRRVTRETAQRTEAREIFRALRAADDVSCSV